MGIDSLGIERDQTDHATHKGLLSNNIIIIEGLRLAAVSPGEYISGRSSFEISKCRGSG